MYTTGDFMRSNTFTVNDIDALVAEFKRHHISLSVDANTPDDWHDVAGHTAAANTLTLRGYAGMPSIDPYLWGTNADGACWEPRAHPERDPAACVNCPIPMNSHPDTSWIAQDVPQVVSRHLAPGQVAVFHALSIQSRMEWLSGYALAINSAGERREVSLYDINDLAAELTDQPVTEAAN